MLMPRQPVPSLAVPTLAHGSFDLAKEVPDRFTLLCFYRGLHCPVCAMYLRELESKIDAFAARGVNVLALSSDGEDRAREMAKKIGATCLRVGYGLSLPTARAWGLFLSTSRGKTSIGIEEPDLFSEPGVFLVRPDGTLYWSSVQSMPFARPNFGELVQALDFVIKNDYPARGEFVGSLPS
ncbi:peroxiredoxin-like family protein [Variovorax sp. Root434]|uniref:peroxiredoxin-like family protein n=1 Tax=Variovorax sp. Root434 TaxID=1736536 RepID=UPI0006F8B2E1|nr:peroxiredoxin-like family protein [Variovorax sp. Root434]KQX21483.1 alkyl hydroperoxide reductase [Variovorax sp. Root434]